MPSLTRAAEICAALDLELYIGPPRSGSGTLRSQIAAISRPGQAASGRVVVPSTPDQVDGAPVTDRALATLLAAIVSHWKALESHYARSTWIDDLYRWCPALSAQRSARSSRGSDGG